MEIFTDLSKHFNVEFDDGGSIGRRYRRQDEVGTPFCITIDDETLNNNTVTIRHRDTMEQIRLPIAELKNYIQEKLYF